MLIARNEKGLAPCEWPHKFKRSNCVWITSPMKTKAILLGFQAVLHLHRISVPFCDTIDVGHQMI
ncbi:hypothetical protein HanPSC8_Chr03g0123621 [Helianthus annuus]|nr:hypothetical protein HanPSC8_Chr03g0123621 [Helianthus annuus]